jgi:FtsH-binding integral membrane protein
MTNAETFPRIDTPVAHLATDARATFISRTYGHLFGAIVGFVLLQVFLFQTGLPAAMLRALGRQPAIWLLFLGGFVLVGWLASSTAMRARSLPAQYLALGGFVGAEALLFAPMLWIAETTYPGVAQTAGLVTVAAFAGLTAVVFVTRKDFSFLGAVLRFGGIAALITIVVAVVAGMNLGAWFSVAMIAFAGAAILHDTSNVLHRYPETRYVAAALALFASVALMFWYVLRLVMALRE